MKYSEKWGTDVDEAVRLALEELGATEDQIQVTVIEEPSKGFLGLGAKLAKVKVELIGNDSVKDKNPNKGNIKKQTSEHKHKRDLRKKDKAPQSSGGNRQSSGNKPSGGNRNSGQRNDRNNNHGKKEKQYFPPIDISDKPVLSEKPAGLVEDSDSGAAEFLKDLVAKMGLDVDVASFKNEECFYVELSGKDSRTIIGKRGQTLDSIQYLTNLVVNKEREKYIRTIIDVEGYRLRREKTLEQLGAKLARKVQQSGRRMKLEPMNPYERKVIHATLQGVEGITTRSEGEEPYRRVIIEKK